MADLEFPMMDEKLEIATTNEILKDKNNTHFSTYCVASGRNYARLCDGDYQKTAEHIKKVAGKLSDDQVIMYPDHVKRFCDRAFYSQLMQMADAYMDGHDGEWIMPPAELEKMMRPGDEGLLEERLSDSCTHQWRSWYENPVGHCGVTDERFPERKSPNHSRACRLLH